MEQRKSFAVGVCTPSLLSHNQTKGRLHTIPETMVRHRAALLGNIRTCDSRQSQTAINDCILYIDSFGAPFCCIRTLLSKEYWNEQSVSTFHTHQTDLRCRPFECLYRSAVLEFLPQQHNSPLINLRSLLRDSCGREICPRIPKTVAVLL